MNYLFSQNYLITILQAEKSVRYNGSPIYRGSKGVIKCITLDNRASLLGSDVMVTGAKKIILSKSRDFGTKQFIRVMYYRSLL